MPGGDHVLQAAWLYEPMRRVGDVALEGASFALGQELQATAPLLQSSCGRNSSGASLRNIHFSNLAGACRLAHGVAIADGNLCPVGEGGFQAGAALAIDDDHFMATLQQVVAVLMPMMPAPRTRVFMPEVCRRLRYFKSRIKLSQDSSVLLMNPFDPAALECLAAIVEEGGFERAAQRLSITQSAVSQRLRALEADVGTVLIVRSRPLRPTAAGKLLLKHTKQMRLLRADVERELRELAPSTTGGGGERERHLLAINADSIATGAARRDGLAARACRWRSSPTTRTHARMAARGPGARWRHDREEGLARLQGGATGGDALPSSGRQGRRGGDVSRKA